jgi:hypothetical protein
MPRAWQEKQHLVFGHMLLENCKLKVELETSEGKIVLEGISTVTQPVATEPFDLGRRIRRILPQ